ncbi:flagellar biosynthetic protein FliO [Cellulomonas sp. DKR-3]|uniref:Flagellar biosynthetic protein FliO n=1 Tax=Cellulomonas fulva TaxID=2835530 RepID=A0ABS5TV76_9CELL|nr:flagellar biosynthetic protein FliO [Cellulomonas fulva]MBT0993062.1 flagellar biosynthetic protein FliO [Cellulomonas fulva]
MDGIMLVARVVLSLACVVGLIWFAGRKLSGGTGRVRTQNEHDVRVVGRQGMGRHAGVAVVAVGNRRILVGYGEQQVTMLTELGPVVAAPASGTPPAPPPRQQVAPRPAARPAPQVDRPADRTSDGITAALGAAVKPGKLEGSVLAPDTWRTFVRTLQERTVRR